MPNSGWTNLTLICFLARRIKPPKKMKKKVMAPNAIQKRQETAQNTQNNTMCTDRLDQTVADVETIPISQLRQDADCTFTNKTTWYRKSWADMSFINSHKNRKGYNGDPHQWHNTLDVETNERLGATPRPEMSRPNREMIMETSER